MLRRGLLMPVSGNIEDRKLRLGSQSAVEGGDAGGPALFRYSGRGYSMIGSERRPASRSFLKDELGVNIPSPSSFPLIEQAPAQEFYLLLRVTKAKLTRLAAA